MISNNIKTILFASLIAAMVLPFSRMQYAEAKQTETIQDLVDKYANEYTELQTKIDNSNDRVKIQEWINKQLDIIDKVEALILEYTGNVADVQVIINSQVNDDVSVDGTTSKYFSKSGTQVGCDNNSESWSFYGTIYYDRNYFWMTTNYPSDVSEGSFPECSDKPWGYNLYTETENLFSFGNEKCASNFTIGNYASSKFICPGSTYSWGELWSIKNVASYTNGSPISALTIVWLL